MQDYQRTKNNPYFLRKALYRRMVWLVRDYDNICAELNEMLHSSPTYDGLPRGADTGNPTESLAIRREKLLRQTEAVEQSLMKIPEEYRQGVFEHVKDGVRFPDSAHPQTWKSWQAKFLYQTAKKLGEI